MFHDNTKIILAIAKDKQICREVSPKRIYEYFEQFAFNLKKNHNIYP